MKIYLAVKNGFKTQGFGIKETSSYLLPMYQSMGLTAHNGYDFSCQDNQEVYFDLDIAGTVLNTEIDGAGGLGINIISEDKDGIFKHRYWHLKGFNVVAGQEVGTGDLIGRADNTGRSTATHLHRDLKPMVKDTLGNYQQREPDNGYAGCVDLKPYYNPIFIGDLMANLKGQISIIQKIINAIRDYLSTSA